MGISCRNPASPISRYSGEVVPSEEFPEGWWGSWVAQRATESQSGDEGIGDCDESVAFPFSSFFLDTKNIFFLKD